MGRSGMRRSRSGSRSRVSRSASRERNDSREGRSRSGSGSRGDDRSRSGSRSRRRDSRSGSRSRRWSRSQSAQSRSPSAGGGRNGERFSHKSPDDRRDSPEGAGGISEATKSSYAAFATAYPSSSSYASDPNAYPSYQNPSSFTPSSGFSGEHPYPPITYSTAYPSTSTSYSTNTYETSQENPSYSSQCNETTYSNQPANQAANSPRSSSSHHNSDDSDGLDVGKGDETMLDLEEVGDEVDDTYGSSMIRSVEESISDALMQGIQRGKRLREVQKEVSSKNLTDWELKCVLENPSKSIETMPPPGAQDPQLSGELARRNEMWTPTLDRRSATEAKQKMSRRTNDWEIETPYITRSSKASSGGQGVGRDVSKVVDTVAGLKMDMKLSSQQKGTKTLFPSAVLEADTLSSVAQSYSSFDESSKRMPPPKEFAVPDIPLNSSSSKKTEGSDSTKEVKKSQSKRGGEESSSSKKSGKEKKEKKKKKKRRKRASSSDSDIASDTDDSEIDKKKEAQERAKKEAKERIKLLEKKDELLNKVHLLVVEREKLERQRDEIVQNHKGDSKSLKSILEENSGLMKEIHKQIFSMDEMISKVNSALGIADQGQEKPRDLLGKMKSPPQPPPPPSMARHSSSTPPVVRKVESTVDNEAYGSLPALKTLKDISPLKTVQVKYVDQGMHWCKLCGIFCNNLTGYIEHLESPSHVESTKMEKKTWLAKAARPEKERIAPNAQTITEPLQGSEFLHSILVFYCSLCDSFLRDKKEAIHHPESKLHVSMYKNHLANNSMYEASYMKAKMGAYATFKINQEKQKRESLESLEREKGLKKEVREKDLAEMRHKGSKEGATSFFVHKSRS